MPMSREEAWASLGWTRTTPSVVFKSWPKMPKNTISFSRRLIRKLLPAWHRSIRRKIIAVKRKNKQKKFYRCAGRKKQENIDRRENHEIDVCPYCHTPTTQNSVTVYTRLIEDIEPVQTIVNEHIIHGSLCPTCRKIIGPMVKDVLPCAIIGLRLMVLSAWLHYIVGVSVNNLVKVLSVFLKFFISPGRLAQAWLRLTNFLEPDYESLGQEAAGSTVLNGDETGWRLNGITHWLWAFAD